jgi:hypothetical protein
LFILFLTSKFLALNSTLGCQHQNLYSPRFSGKGKRVRTAAATPVNFQTH